MGVDHPDQWIGVGGSAPETGNRCRAGLRFNIMKLPKVPLLLAVLLVFGLALSSCDGQTVGLSTTSSLLNVGTAPPPSVGSTTTTTESIVTTSPTLVGDTVEGYDIVARESTADGEILYIVIPQGAYTDVDLENFVGDLIESGTASWGAEIFDDVLAVDVFRKASTDRTEEEAELLAQHHFVSLVSGNTIRYQGPFEESGEFAIGS